MDGKGLGETTTNLEDSLDGELYQTGDAHALDIPASPFGMAASSECGYGSGSEGHVDPKCDDCSRTEPIRIWRWCRDCERVLCETCCVEGHFTHEINSYSTAVRRSNEEFRKVEDEINRAVEQLRKGANVANELKDEILSRLNALKLEGRGKIDEARDVENTLKEHINSMLKLKELPLNAATWKEREDCIAGLEDLLRLSMTMQNVTKEHLKRIDGIIDESRVEINRIFREGM